MHLVCRAAWRHIKPHRLTTKNKTKWNTKNTYRQRKIATKMMLKTEKRMISLDIFFAFSFSLIFTHNGNCWILAFKNDKRRRISFVQPTIKNERRKWKVFPPNETTEKTSTLCADYRLFGLLHDIHFAICVLYTLLWLDTMIMMTIAIINFDRRNGSHAKNETFSIWCFSCNFFSFVPSFWDYIAFYIGAKICESQPSKLSQIFNYTYNI